MSKMPSMRSIRSDERSWEIEAESAAEGTLRALETAGLIMLEMVLHRFSAMHTHDQDTEMALKALGSLSGRVGMTRLAHLTGLDENGLLRERDPNSDHQAAGDMIKAVLDWLLVWESDADAPPSPRTPSPPTPLVARYLSELHAAAFYLDRRAGELGSSGPGTIRKLIRSTSRGVR